jgi:2-polyprenyl-6-hydroxyphenyl methylase/3-demethylubiquinone-9 3-methyltransferase
LTVKVLNVALTIVDLEPHRLRVVARHDNDLGRSIDPGDPGAFLKALGRRLAPGGLMILSTPNATGWAKLLMITLAEGVGQIPKGTHDFAKFIGPDRMKHLLAEAGLECLDVEGIAWSPALGLHLSDDVRLNYLVAATHRS